MQLKKFLFIFLFLSNVIVPQQAGTWKNYTDMFNVLKTISQPGGIWSATSGGVFYYNSTDKNYKKFTKSEGLGSNNISAIAMDKLGRIWIGTSEGFINIYNPKNDLMQSIFDINETNRSKKQINDISILNDTVFVSTDFGISLIDLSSLNFIETVVKFGDFPTESKVNGIFRQSQIYVATDEGMAISKKNSTNLSSPTEWDTYKIGSGSSKLKINKIVKFGNDKLLATDRGLYKFSNDTLTLFLYNGFNIKDMQVQKNSLYAVLSSTIHNYSGTEDKVVFSQTNSTFNSLILDNNSDLLVSSSKGVIKFSGTDTTVIVPNGPISNSFPSIVVDKNSNLWSATGKDGNGKGIFKFDGINWTIYDKSNTEEIKKDDYHRVDISPDNTVFASNWGNGFTEIKDDNFKSFDTTGTGMIGIPGVPSFLVVYDAQKDSKGNIWALNFWSANRRVLSELTPEGKWYHYEFGNPLFPQVVNARYLVIDQFNTKWFVVTDGAEKGLYYFNENDTPGNLADDIWGKITTRNGLKNDVINALVLDNRGELVIGTKLGMNVIQNPSDPNSIRGDLYFAIRQQSISSLAIDPLNRKWVGTSAGVFLMSSDGSTLIQNYTESNSPLPVNTIRSISVDSKKGIVYFGTDFGLTSLTTIAIQPAKTFSKLFVYPNPLILGSGNSSNATIDGLIQDSQIKILSISGKLINEFPAFGGKITPWDGKDFNGNFVSSGIYIIVAFDEEANSVAAAKVAVIRK